MRRRPILVCLAACVSVASHAGAQGWDGLATGSRVSIRVADSLLPPGLARKNAIVGLVVQRAPEAIYLQITSDDTGAAAGAIIGGLLPLEHWKRLRP